MKTIIFISAVVFFNNAVLSAQNTDLKKEDPKNDPVYEYHQFYLKEPAVKILDLEYDNDCTPAHGRLSEDGKTVLIKSYTEHSRIYLKFLKADGKVEELTKSPCYIDPVVPSL